jgi:regulatory protein
MIITKLEEYEKGKTKVYIDEEYRFILYNKDLKCNHIEEQGSISEAVYEDIRINTVLRRAKQKAMAILKFMDRTEQELINKLKMADYTEDIISEVINYIKSYHYIDDMRYAINYIHSKKNNKSKRQIYSELVQKGIDKMYLEQAFNLEYEDEDIAIKRALAKKNTDICNLTENEKLKLAASLYRKGFQADLIKKYLNN